MGALQNAKCKMQNVSAGYDVLTYTYCQLSTINCQLFIGQKPDKQEFGSLWQGFSAEIS